MANMYERAAVQKYIDLKTAERAARAAVTHPGKRLGHAEKERRMGAWIEAERAVDRFCAELGVEER